MKAWYICRARSKNFSRKCLGRMNLGTKFLFAHTQPFKIKKKKTYYKEYEKVKVNLRNIIYINSKD